MKKRLLVLLGIFVFFVHPEFTTPANAQYWTVLKNGAKWAKRSNIGFRIPKTTTYNSTRASTTYRTTSAPSSLYPNGRVTHTTIKGRWGATTRQWKSGYKFKYKPSKLKINQVVRNAVKKSAVKVPIRTVARTGQIPTTRAASQVKLPQQTGPPSPTRATENKALLAGRKKSDDKLHITYTKKNPNTEKVYSGMASGNGNPETILRNRYNSHHRRGEGYQYPVLDKVSKNRDAIRGREQQLIMQNGGAQSQGGSSGNKINGISEKNKKRETYFKAAEEEFGKIK